MDANDDEIGVKSSDLHKIREDFYRVGDTENFSAANYFFPLVLLNY